MINIINSCQDPYFNLALEEYILTEMDPRQKYFMLWQNHPTVVVGRHQNTSAEINEAFIQEKGINVVRRLSGGGAVYHDDGNLNFTFIMPEPTISTFEFTRFTRPVIKTLAILGVEARDEGRNDITIAGMKISGNAQCRHKGRLLHHGTILYSTDLDTMEKALAAGPDKFVSRGIASIRSRVTNICDHLPGRLSLDRFKKLLTEVIKTEEPSVEYHLNENDLKQAEHLKQSKYSTWDWNYGSSPAFNVQKKGRFKWGGVELRLQVEKGIITDCRIFGDFFALKETAELERQFLHRRYRSGDIGRLEDINLGEYITGAEWKDIRSLFE